MEFNGVFVAQEIIDEILAPLDVFSYALMATTCKYMYAACIGSDDDKPAGSSLREFGDKHTCMCGFVDWNVPYGECDACQETCSMCERVAPHELFIIGSGCNSCMRRVCRFGCRFVCNICDCVFTDFNRMAYDREDMEWRCWECVIKHGLRETVWNLGGLDCGRDWHYNGNVTQWRDDYVDKYFGLIKHSMAPEYEFGDCECGADLVGMHNSISPYSIDRVGESVVRKYDPWFHQTFMKKKMHSLASKWVWPHCDWTWAYGELCEQADCTLKYIAGLFGESE